ncbi:GH17618 [Drosophila grimshawi]|uniref:GH17618 n=1 Tax=Drosophila grimshawi TaxID=7222 RepID=B4JX82_DROGR|nr:GH17618 [Drosophila grimshawi]
MARKDDPVFNVKFVQLVESQPCLWNYTHPGYSKKDEVQRAWQHVANEIKDTVRNSRERWRTIRSSFLRSLKLARTQTGRGKRKYYLSKYLQFLIPYTKSRGCHKQQSPAVAANTQSNTPNPQTEAEGESNAHRHPNPNLGMVLRKPSTSTTATFLALSTAPMTRIGHMRLMGQHQPHQQPPQPQHNPSDEDTKDSITTPTDVHLSALDRAGEQEREREQEQEQNRLETPPPRLQAIKMEPEKMFAAQQQLVTLPVTMAAALRNNMDWTVAEWLKGSNHQLQFHTEDTPAPPPAAFAPPAPPTPALTLTAQPTSPDADYSFLISLHPYLKEMSGKQNRRFRQKVVGLIDNVLDNIDV